MINLREKSTTKTRQWIMEHYGNAVAGVSIYLEWFAKFKMGGTKEYSGKYQKLN